MSNESPVSILFSRDGYDVVITENNNILPEQPAIILAGKNNSTTKFISVTNDGYININGSITSNIGITNGLALDSSINGILRTQGSITLNQTGPLIFGAVTTSLPSYINSQTFPLSLTTSGLLRIDGSNVTQPISGTITANAGSGTFNISGSVSSSQSGTWNINNISGSINLPTGASTESTLSTRLSDSTFTNRINTLGQKLSANSTPVVLSSDQSAIPVTDNSSSLTIDSQQLPSSLISNRLDANLGAWLGSTSPTVGQKTMINSVPVTIASDQSVLQIKKIISTISSVTSVAASTSNITLKTSNSNRLGLTVFNDSSKTLYLKLGSTASTSSYTVKIVKDSYYEIPYEYTGVVDGIWEIGVIGNALITELT